jgi:UDP-glucose 4-epimerase
MLHDVASAHGMDYVVLRYFNVAGADPQARIGLATIGATHLLKIAVEAATGQRAKVDVFGTDYPTPDGSCIRDFIHVSDLAQAHRAALSYLRGGGNSMTLNCGYGRGYSVLETIEAVRRTTTISKPSPPTRWPGKRSCSASATVKSNTRPPPKILFPLSSQWT